jgi:hypothetical protein
MTKRYIYRNILHSVESMPTECVHYTNVSSYTNTGGCATFMWGNEGVAQNFCDALRVSTENSCLLALPNHGGKTMKNETSFRLTDAMRNCTVEIER